jgi:hypothetical protein
MTFALVAAAACIAFVAAVGLLFGQLFAGHFSVTATVAGVAGRGAAASALGLTADARWAPRAGWNCGVVALAAAVLDAAHYYWKLDIPGNYYGWGQMAPFCASLLFVALAARRSRRGESDAAR